MSAEPGPGPVTVDYAIRMGIPFPDGQVYPPVGLSVYQVSPTEEGVFVHGGGGEDHEAAMIPWGQAIAVARRIIELARGRGDLS